VQRARCEFHALEIDLVIGRDAEQEHLIVVGRRQIGLGVRSGRIVDAVPLRELAQLGSHLEGQTVLHRTIRSNR